MKLLALILAYILSHLVAKPHRFRQFDWYESWSKWFRSRTNWSTAEFSVIVIVATPVLLVSVILLSLFDSVIWNLLVSIVILSYCIGPESLEEDVDSGEIKKKLGIRKNAKVAVLIKRMTQLSLQRWFGVFFWYVVLGVVGALIYRLSERLDFYTSNESNLKATIEQLMKILNYPVAWMMVVSLAIASDFERIFKKCKAYMNSDNIKSMNDTFLYEAADFAVENCEVEADSDTSIEQVTINVLKRMLIVWLVFVSILVILAV
jgi:membrane protein required for beta-lactamase induction